MRLSIPLLLVGILGIVVMNLLKQPLQPIATVVSGNQTEAFSPAFNVMWSLFPLLVLVLFFLTVIRALSFGGETRAGDRVREFIRLDGLFGSLKNSPFIKRDLVKASLPITGADLAKIIGVKTLFCDNLRDNNDLGYEPMDIILATKTWCIDNNFTWYIIEKHPDFELYKMVGLHNRQRGLNCIYLVGKDAHTDVPYLVRCPPEYFKAGIEECRRWSMGAKSTDKITEV